MASPVVETNNPTVFVNSPIAASDLFTATDPDDQIVSYTFWDFRSQPNTGYFELDGIPLANGGTFTIVAADLPKLRYFGGSQIGYEGFRVVARDQVGNFSDPLSIGRVYSVRSNTTAPHVARPDFAVLADEVIAARDFVRGFDPDGYPLTHFQFSEANYVSVLTAGNGRIWVGSYQHRFTTGDVVTIRGANQSAYNISASIVVTNDNVFYMDVPGILPGTGTGPMRVHSQDYGHFELDGVAFPQGDTFQVTAEELDRLVYRAQGPNDAENIYLRGYDGVSWSYEKRGVAETLVNASRPVVQFSRSITPAEQEHDFASALNITDADGNSIKSYMFFNTTPHANYGDLIYQGQVMPRKEWFTVPADKLDQVSFETPNSGLEQLIRVRAFDGKHWSGAGTHTITSTPPIIRPELEATEDVIVAEQRDTVQLAGLFEKVDRGELHTRVQVYEGDPDPRSGNLVYGVTPLAGSQIHEFDVLDFNQNVKFNTGDFYTRHLDTVYQRNFNGNDWSAWNKIDIRTEPEIEDVLTSGTTWVGLMPINQAGKLEISFSFMQRFPNYNTGEARNDPPPEHFEIFNDAQRANTRLALRHMEEFLNVQFVEVADSSTNVFGGEGGIIRFGEYGRPFPESTASAFAFFPGFGDSPGDVWINRLNYLPGPSLEFQVDTWGYKVLIHELGHAMGLKHPHDGTPRLPPSVDVNDFSVMSYQQAANGEPATYQLYDIDELQDLYGANMDFHAGDNLYSIGNYFNRTAFVETIWDAGGEDTLSAAGSSNPAVIDLRAGQQSSIGVFPNNVTIAFDVVIEHGVGSDLDDSLFGNHADNTLNGGLGNDFLAGNAGVDLLIGGEGDDTFLWGVGDHNDVINEQGLGGRDLIQIADFPGVDSLSGDLRFSLSGRDLLIDLRIDGGGSEAVLTVQDQLFNGFRVETLEIGGQQIDLVNLTSQIAPGVDTFVTTGQSSPFGLLVAPA